MTENRPTRLGRLVFLEDGVKRHCDNHINPDWHADRAAWWTAQLNAMQGERKIKEGDRERPYRHAQAISDLRCIQAKPEPLYAPDLRIVAERAQAC